MMLSSSLPQSSCATRSIRSAGASVTKRMRITRSAARLHKLAAHVAPSHQRAMAALAADGGDAHGGERRVAVVGGGVSGLFCASTLSAYGYNVSLFDMGKTTPGRRL